MKATSINEIISLLRNLTKSDSKVNYRESRTGDIKLSLGNKDIMENYLGFSPRFDTESGLKKWISQIENQR